MFLPLEAAPSSLFPTSANGTVSCRHSDPGGSMGASLPRPSSSRCGSNSCGLSFRNGAQMWPLLCSKEMILYLLYRLWMFLSLSFWLWMYIYIYVSIYSYRDFNLHTVQFANLFSTVSLFYFTFQKAGLLQFKIITKSKSYSTIDWMVSFCTLTFILSGINFDIRRWR